MKNISKIYSSVVVFQMDNSYNAILNISITVISYITSVVYICLQDKYKQYLNRPEIIRLTIIYYFSCFICPS